MPTAVVVGFIGKIPLAGMTLYNLHYLAGLQELGYDVHYVERQNAPDEYYDPDANAMGADVRSAIPYITHVLREFGLDNTHYSIIDNSHRCLGSGWRALRQSLDSADFVLTLADPTWFDELERCPRRAFVDGDPMFTQVAMLSDGHTATVLSYYPVLFSYGTRQGADDCSIPSADRKWIPTSPVVASSRWTEASPTGFGAATTVMNWSAWSSVHFQGRSYGQKGQELQRLLRLPAHTERECVLAIGGAAPRETLVANGWQLRNPIEVTRTLDTYRDFIGASFADLGICKHAYIASRSGWFSDRSLCYLASGRPVLHQDTGFLDWLKAREGVIAFSTVEEAAEGLRAIAADYRKHARAARTLAVEWFEARTVLGRMLDQAGFR